MFIETLEFTIPVDLCSLCTTLQKSTQSGLEFPASVNSYGTTQDASIQVALKANKLTFKVDGVSSNASIISKSECRTLKLSVFDVDRTLIPQESDTFSPNNVSNFHQSTPVSNSQKRTFNPSPTPVRAKIRRNSGGENKKTKSPNADRVKDSYFNNRSKPMDNSSSNNVLIKTEPEDPDLIEIDPDPEPLKTEQPEQSSSCMYDQTSHSSYEQNVPHVQDYSEPSTSHQRPPSQNVDDFLVFQDDSYENDDNEEYSNDGSDGSHQVHKLNESTMLLGERNSSRPQKQTARFLASIFPQIESMYQTGDLYPQSQSREKYQCEECGKSFTEAGTKRVHVESVHHNAEFHYSMMVLAQRFSTPINPQYGHAQGQFSLSDPGNFESFLNSIPPLRGSSDKRLWECEHCGKTFTNSNNKRFHVQAVHGNKTYGCVCGKQYKYPCNLIRHKNDCALAKQSDPSQN